MPERAAGPLLALVPNVGAAEDGERVFLDTKACDGLAHYARHWPGPVRCVSRAGDPARNSYGRWMPRRDLPFEMVCVPADAPAEALVPHLADAALVAAGADDDRDRSLPDLLPRIPVVMTIEYDFRTRIDMTLLGGGGMIRKARTLAWLARKERRLRRSLARAAGVQANGQPAFDAYAPLNPHPLLFFDTRLGGEGYIGATGAEAKAVAVANRHAPLRLAFSGRLERIKGADQLVPLMRALAARGCQASLDVFGTGSLVDGMRREIGIHRLGDRVTLHGAVDFRTALVPALKADIDLFFCPHPQADPSCAYLETLGCGVPIVGFLNRAFAGVLELGDCGIGVPIGRVDRAADAIAGLDRDRAALARLTRGAAEVARPRLFEMVIKARVEHLVGTMEAYASR